MSEDMGKPSENRKHLTKTLVESLQIGPKDVIVWDDEVPGFFIKLTPQGSRVFGVYYRTKAGQQRKPKIGAFGVLTVEKARKTAREWLMAAAQGGDPSGERKTLRNAETVSQLIERYLEEAAKHKKPRSLAEDKRNLEKYVNPEWGGRKVASITEVDAVRLLDGLKDTPIQSNRVRAVLSVMFNLAESPWRLRPEGTNPVRNIKPHKEKKRERYLSPEELARLNEVLDYAEATKTESPAAVAAIRLLLLTGCRLGEILDLKWDYVDFDESCLRLPDSKTGAKVVYISAPAVEILAERFKSRGSSPWVLGMGDYDKRLKNLHNPWNRIRKAAGIPDVRLHDGRHTFGATGAGLGINLQQVGKVMGHKTASTMVRYQHVAPSPARQAAETISAAIAEAMKTGAKIVEVKPAKDTGEEAKGEGGK